MELGVERAEGIVYCSVEGRVDGDTAVDFRGRVLDGVGAGDRALVLDLSGVPYVSSAGLQSFIIIARQLSRDGTAFGLCGLAEGVREVFEISGFDLVLSLYVDRAEAAAALSVMSAVEC